MKKLIVLASFVAIVTGCNKKVGELVGVEGREKWFQPDPFGTLYIPMGSYQMGQSDEEITMAHTAHAKQVSVQAFILMILKFQTMNIVSLYIGLEIQLHVNY